MSTSAQEPSGAPPVRALGDVLAAARPGVPLADLLARLVPADMPDDAVVEGIAASERLAAWAHSLQAGLVAELNRRRSPGAPGSAADEVSARLATTRAAAEALVGLAVGLESHPGVADALAAGEIDARRAVVLVDVMHVPPSHRDAVIGAVLPMASSLTVPQLRRRMQRAEIEVSPGCAQARAVKERAARHAEIRPAHSGMAWLSFYLPAVDARTVWNALDALAHAEPEGLDGSVERAFDPRGVDARRVDALVDLAASAMSGAVVGGAGVDAGTGRGAGRRAGRPHLLVSATLESLVGLTDDPAELDGHGPVPVQVARDLLRHSTWEPLLRDAATGAPLATSTRRYRTPGRLRRVVEIRDVTCTFPGCRVGAERCDMDHVEAFDHAASADGRRPPQTRPENLHALCRYHHRLKTLGGWSVARDDRTGVTTWTAPSGLVHRRPAYPVLSGWVEPRGQQRRRVAARTVPDRPPPGWPSMTQPEPAPP